MGQLLTQDPFEVLGIPTARFIGSAWVQVEGYDRGSHAYPLDRSRVKILSGNTIEFTFPADPEYPEFDAICQGRAYTIAPHYNHRSALLIARVDDPREVPLLFVEARRFKIHEESLRGESLPAESLQTIGYIRREKWQKEPFGRCLTRVTEITGDDQYRIVANDYGDNRIACSANLSGKRIQFFDANISIERHVLIDYTRRDVLPPFTVYLAAIVANQVKPTILSVRGALDRSFNNYRYNVSAPYRKIRLNNYTVIRNNA